MAFDHAVHHIDDVLPPACFAIFQAVDGIEQHASHEANLIVTMRQAVVATKRHARKVLQFELIDVTVDEEGRKGIFCLVVVGIGRIGQRLWSVGCVTVFPHLAHQVGVVGDFALTQRPHHFFGLTLFEFLEGADGVYQCKFADVALGCFNVREGAREGSFPIDVGETYRAHRSVARKDDIARKVLQHAVVGSRVGAFKAVVTSLLLVKDGGEGSRQSVLAHLPTVAGVERWSLLGRTQVLVVPESGHIEVTIVVADAIEEQLLAVVEIDSLKGGDAQADGGDTFGLCLCPARHSDGQGLRCRELSLVSRELVGRGRIAGGD